MTQRIFQRVSILDPILQETYTVHLEKETFGWRGWIPQLPKVDCKSKTKKTPEYTFNQTP